jgi:transketolase
MTPLTKDDLTLVANTIRCLAMDGVQAANSGHPGMPMGMADVASVLWLKYLKHCPANPKWADRDRFVLSAGHGSMLLYSLLHLAGYKLPMDELKRFRQLGSRTPGHPEHGETEGVETTTGPLGQGIGNAVGMAIAERMLAARFNSEAFIPVDHRTWAICGDGDFMEGVSHEACSLAGHIKLDRLIVFYDSNRITIEGSTDLAYSDDVKKRFLGYNWHVLEIDGHDYDKIDAAIRRALRLTGKPVCILCHTHIGKGSPNKADNAEAHGAPLGAEEVKLTKRALGFAEDQAFAVPDKVYTFFEERAAKLLRLQNRWARGLKTWQQADATRAELWRKHMQDELPADLDSLLPAFDPAKPLATRSASGVAINALCKHLPQLVGGSADLAPSTMTLMKGEGDIGPGQFAGRNFHFGVREHGMLAAMNGLALHGGFRVFGATFFVFSDYCRPSLRLAAIMKLPVIFVFTHDSFYVGEDGPTHEPVEHIAALRCIPGLTVLRPADPTETAAAWVAALKHKQGPVALLLTRHNLPVLDRTTLPAANNLEKGAYTLWQSGSGTPDLTILASGSEVDLALNAAKQFAGTNVRVVSFPSWELFAAQPQAYRDSVLDPACRRRLVIEAGSAFGWERWIGRSGATVTMDRFGASGAYKDLAKAFGFTVENVLAKARGLLAG